MKHLKKYIPLICALCLMLCVLSGCGDDTVDTQVYELPAEFTNVSSGKVAENQYFTMNWNAEKAAVSFTSKKDGSVWATTPQEYIDSTADGPFSAKESLSSSLSISSRSKKSESESIYYASTSCVDLGYFTSEKESNGIKITYYFDQIESTVSVKYYLEEDAFKISVDPKDVKCYGDSVIASVTPAAFVCSAKVTANGDKSSYLAIPSGSGALIYCDARNSLNNRTFSSAVYGDDYSIEKYEDSTNDTPITMPFYGVKVGNSALCAIIEQGAESSVINADAPFTAGEYANVSATYNVVGYNNVYNAGTWHTKFNEKVEENLSPVVIGYYALTGNNANYTGIAQRYKKYLTEKENMEKSQKNSLLTVKLIGGYVEDDLVLGIPKKKNVSLTSYEEAQEILKELNDISSGSLVADMYGYGSGGINATKLAGGYKLTGVNGNKKQLLSFLEFANNSSIKTFFNFDTVVFCSSGSGFSISKDVALNVNGITSTVRQFLYSNRGRLSISNGGRIGAMVERSKLAKAVEKTVNLSDKYGITGLAYNTLGNVIYSDYNEDDNDNALYPLKAQMGDEVSTIIKDTKANSKTVMIDGAYSYAASVADILTGCPTSSDQSNVFDAEVPLYQIVFQGTKANSVTAINTATNPRTQFLKAIETGSGLSFTLMANYTGELRKQYMRGLNATLYSDNIDKIKSYVDESKSFLASVADSAIAKHEIVTADVTKTVFENGVVVYVNYGDTNYVSDIGTVKANSFLSK